MRRKQDNEKVKKALNEVRATIEPSDKTISSQPSWKLASAMLPAEIIEALTEVWDE